MDIPEHTVPGFVEFLLSAHEMKVVPRILLGLMIGTGCRLESHSAGLDPDPNAIVAIGITPAAVDLAPADTVRFRAVALRARGDSVAVSDVGFEATGGAVDGTGLYRAGPVGDYEVRAHRGSGSAELGALARVKVRHPPPPPPAPPPPPPPPAPPPPPPPSGPVGINADLSPRRLFPADNPWNQPIDTAQIDPSSDAIITNIGVSKAFHPDFGANWNGGPFGIPYIVVSGTQPPVPVTFDYSSESDPGPYPIPANAPIEGGASSSGDRHVLIVDRDAWKLYELFAAYPQANGSWHAGSGAVFDLSSNALRPAGWTSADAAGLPILAGLVRYDEVVAGEIAHALRFTVSVTRRAYIPPARHWASSNTSTLRPPMGMRVRLKSSFNIAGYSARVQVILRALKKYGMIVADNGSDWYLSGVADARWNDGELNTLKQLRGSDFEVVRMSGVVVP